MSVRVTPAIPASQIVNIVPSVLSAGGTALDLLGVMLTQSNKPPIGTVQSFADADDVEDYFGPTSPEAAHATIYFKGSTKTTRTPNSLNVAQYPASAVNGWLRGGNISGLPLATLQGFNATLSVVIDGAGPTTQTVNLSAATSFSNAASIIGSTLAIHGTQDAMVTGAIATTVLTVSAVGSGTIALGDVVTGAGVTAGTYITSFGTGTGGTGTYNVNNSQTIASEALTVYKPGVTYDPFLGAFQIWSGTTGASSSVAFATGAMATNLLLTSATGAVVSPGAAAAVPGAFMDSLINITTNWASFWTLWEPSDADKEAFCTWLNGQNNQFVYEMWSTNVTDAASGAASPVPAFVIGGNLSGIAMTYDSAQVDTVGGELAAFGAGVTAAIDFTRRNGRMTMAFQKQEGLQPQVFDASTAQNLIGHGLNLYGDYTTPNQAFIWYYPGSISGQFTWKDSYVSQIWLNKQLQLALMVLEDTVGTIPYSPYGYALMESACMDPINQGVNAGVIVAGVPLSSQQAAIVNGQAGVQISDVLTQRGWYIQILPAIAQVRKARTSPPATLWYCDGGSIQQISLNSVEIQ